MTLDFYNVPPFDSYVNILPTNSKFFKKEFLNELDHHFKTVMELFLSKLFVCGEF